MNPFKIAKKILAKRGWCKGNRHNEKGQSCLLGAFENNAGTSVYNYLFSDAPEVVILKDVIVKKFSDRLGYDQFNNINVGPHASATFVIACFNNHPQTTLADVNAVLDACAKRITPWHNVEMELVIEFTAELFDTLKPDVQAELNPLLPPDWIEDVPIELHIEFKSSGYYDPGRWGTRPEDGYPPEGADDRVLQSVYLMTLAMEDRYVNGHDRRWIDDQKIELPRDLQEQLFYHFQKQVDEVELPE